jgi:hypothetical protein
MDSVQQDPVHDTGGGDHDQPFDGFNANQFTLRQRVRLVLLRGRAQDARFGEGAWAGDIPPLVA